MNSEGRHRALFLSLLSLSAGGCESLASLGPFQAGGKSPALQSFSAGDGAYFPPFISDFFANTQRYYDDYPSIDEARSEMQLIEVKRLNSADAAINEANLSWSADGVYLSFEAVDGNKRQIKVTSLAGDYSKELVMVPAGRADFLDGIVARAIQSYNAGLSWSHDSARYAFMSNGGVGEYNIYVGAIGEESLPIANSTEKDGYPTWSPTNNEMAFVSARTGNGDIYLADLAGRQSLKRLTTSDDVDIFPTWFPNGRALVFSSGDAQRHDILVVHRSAAGAWSEPQKVTDWEQDDLRPSISPDGKLIAFYATDDRRQQSEGPIWNIHVVPYIKGRTYSRRELARTVVAKDVVVDLNTGPAWTPDSRKIFYVKNDPVKFNPILGYDLFTGRSYVFDTDTKMNRDILVSKLGILSFRAQVGVWDRVFVALTNQGVQLQGGSHPPSRIHYLKRQELSQLGSSALSQPLH